MILGIGTDIAENNRIGGLLEKFGPRFLNRIYIQEEIDYCMGKKDPIPHLSARFALKEAFIKALGIKRDLSLSYFEVGLTGTIGKKDIAVFGRLRDMIKEKNVDSIHFSISHAENYSSATVILEGKEITHVPANGNG